MVQCEEPEDRDWLAGSENRPQASASAKIGVDELTQFFSRYGRSMHVAKHKTLPFDNSKDLKFALVQSGVLLAAIALADGRRKVLYLHFPGDLVVATALSTHPAVKLTAAGEVNMLWLDRAAFEVASRGSPETLELLLIEETGNIERLLVHSAAIGRLRSDERVATFFLEWALRLGRASGNSIVFDCSMRREDIADYLSMNPDSLSRTIAQLRRDKLVVPYGSGHLLTDWKKLACRTPLASAVVGKTTPSNSTPRL